MVAAAFAFAQEGRFLAKWHWDAAFALINLAVR